MVTRFRHELTRWTVALVLMVLAGGSLAFAGGSETRLRSRLTTDRPRDISGQVDFRNRLDEGRRQFSVEIEGFSEGRMFDVMVAGVVVGTVTIDAFGFGNLDFDDTADPDDLDLPFPPNFPAVDGGERVEVGPLSGTLQLK